MGYEDPLKGYSGKLREILLSIGASIGARIRVKRNGEIYEGILMPRHGFAGKQILVLKLDNGYNIGIRVDEKVKIDLITKAREIKFETAPLAKQRIGELPRVFILGTGGTIASRVEYETGAVKPAMSVNEILDIVPELLDIAVIESETILNIFSEDMTPKHWEIIAEEAAKIIESGVSGVIIAHGTDTMAYTAAALAFAIQNLPAPIILVGAQRSSDRPSTDAAYNLKGAVITAAKAPFGEVVIAMHGISSDEYIAIHRGVKARKMHTSRRDTFQSINDIPIAKVDLRTNQLKLLTNRYLPRRKLEEMKVRPRFEPKVALVKVYPGIDPEIIEFLIDKKYKGIVLEGTGLGHIRAEALPAIKRAIEEGIIVVMTSQCLFGRINMNVYTRGRDLLALGVIPGEDMLPETAFVKLSWVLAQTQDPNEVRKLIMTNMVYEINPVHRYELFPRWYHGE